MIKLTKRVTMPDPNAAPQNRRELKLTLQTRTRQVSVCSRCAGDNQC